MLHSLALTLLATLLPATPLPGTVPVQFQAPTMPPDELPCSSYAQIHAQLSRHYAERPVSLGLQSNGNLLQVYASAGSGTWTIVSLTPQGLACVVAAGANWEDLRPAAGTDAPLEDDA